MIHERFLEAFDALSNEIHDPVSELLDEKMRTVYLAGHSFGVVLSAVWCKDRQLSFAVAEQ